jgi:hypothetical protein
MTAHCATTSTTEIDELTADLWDGRISEQRFTDCALHAGINVAEIKAILQELRNDDGVLT